MRHAHFKRSNKVMRGQLWAKHCTRKLRSNLRSDLVADHDEEREVRVSAGVVDHSIGSNTGWWLNFYLHPYLWCCSLLANDLFRWVQMTRELSEVCLMHDRWCLLISEQLSLSSRRWLLPSRISSETTSPGLGLTVRLDRLHLNLHTSFQRFPIW